jgi:crotonobetainyl-CoA:carnitine CoA-transferase CaiB-like acyl-CoA transferase
MLDSALVAMGWVVSNYLIAGTIPRPHGNDNFTAAPSGTFRTRDGLLNISANKQEQFEALANALGREDLIVDPRFAEREARKRNRVVLTAEIEARLQEKPAAEWESALNRAGVPAGRVLDVPAALALPQIMERQLVHEFAASEAAGVARAVPVLKTGFLLDGDGPRPAAPPPRLGQHTDEVLATLGYSPEEVAALRTQGAI